MNRPISLLLTSLAIAACGGAGASPSPSPAPSPASLEGRTFLSQSVTQDGADRPLIPGTRVRLSFMDHQLGASVGCNSMSGSYALDGDRLMLNNAGVTEMGCDPARQAQDDWLFGVLGAQPTLTLDGDDLTLTSGGTVIRLLDRETAEPDLQLAGPVWTVESIITGDVVSSVPQGATATLEIGADGSVALQTGCNSGGGRVAVDGAVLHFSDIITTKRGCAGAAGELEAAVLNLLAADGVSFVIDAQTLTLRVVDRGLQLRGQ